jgi:hypothetical protein
MPRWKERRIYMPRIVDGIILTPADVEPLHKYLLDVEAIERVSDEMRAVIEHEWPELLHKLPPKTPPA